MSATILVAVDDLIFLTKIRETAREVGIRVEAIELAKVQERLGQNPVGAVILDLNSRSGSPLEVLRTLKSNPSTKGVRVVGFVSHVQAEVIRAARAAGCDDVLARSAFSQKLPELLAKLA